MQVVVLANEIQKKELAKEGPEGVIWIEKESQFCQHTAADVFWDLAYCNTPERNNILLQLLPKPVIINSVTDTLQETNPSFIRINGWDTFLSSPVIEASHTNTTDREQIEKLFSVFDKTPEWLPDSAGFITPRVVSMIINEAYLALAEGVSTKEEINTAMKLGTAYPYGPFDWAQKIGLQNIVALLQKLCQTQPRYTPSALMVQESAMLI